MYAIVEIAGQQFKVEKGNKVYVHSLNVAEGSKIEFKKVMMIDDAGKHSIGTPYLLGAKVEAQVEKHLKGDKVIVFKKKRRNGTQKWNNHRQHLTQVSIQNIVAK